MAFYKMSSKWRSPHWLFSIQSRWRGTSAKHLSALKGGRAKYLPADHFLVCSSDGNLQQAATDKVQLLLPLKEVLRSKCLTKNYCSQTCRNADDGVLNVCCNKDKSLQLIDERKVKVGGKEKVEMANSRSDEWASRFTSSLSHRLALAKNVQKIFSRVKKANP